MKTTSRFLPKPIVQFALYSSTLSTPSPSLEAIQQTLGATISKPFQLSARWQFNPRGYLEMVWTTK